MSTTFADKALSLPEVVFHVAKFLEFSDVCVVAQVSRLWNQAVTHLQPWGDFAWDDNPTWEDGWRSMNLTGRDTVMAQLSTTEKARSLTCDFKEFPGKAIYMNQYRDIQKAAWQPIQDTLIKHPSRLHHLNASGCLDSFVFPIMMSATRLHRVTLRSKYEVSKLSQMLNLPNLQQSLRVLSLTDCWWARTGLPFPNKMNFRLTRLDLDKVIISDPDLRRVLEGCKDLRSLTALDVMPFWNVPLLNQMSKHNLQLKVFRFSCKPSANMAGEVDDAQLGWLVTNLVQDLRTLGMYRLNVSLDTWQKFQERFGNLTRLELLGNNHASTGELVHRYLEKSAGLKHLVTENVFISLSLISEAKSSWACRGLKTLEVGFGFGLGHVVLLEPENQNQVMVASKILFEFLARNVPVVERMSIKRTCGGL